MKNWTVADAVATINAGKDVAGIKEITSHFPEFALAVARNDLAAIAAMMPEKMTLRRLQLNAAEAEAEDDEEEGEEAPKTKTSGKAKAAGAEDDGDYSSMTKDQLIALCIEKGLKVAKHQKPKQYYIDALNAAEDDAEEEAPKKAGKASGKKAEAEAEDDEEDDEYTGKSAKELFNMCKERGIKVQLRQASRVYIEALKAADAEAENEDDEEGWGDDDAEEEAPKKSTKGSGKSGKKATKEEDDEEDWDI